ncbi:hypothetical protein crov328 [Cafeteria roenbergensis virus]|uniref:Uncharacterized protein n=1 Tax=Cafeteria roenbergensis virus (strain BV-PW1) TaxID=693272 RepID=E3T599_CROVB|nr:hypothetical protein crov328 [Cafeteria roenbergensis virus BV-PW1]ADO67362.1 hypothetical protein crov328 [Cafeteria roenbergensis virus BV-PW1]
MRIAVAECSVSDKALSLITDYAYSMLKYMGLNFCHFAMIYTTTGKAVKVYSFGYNHIRSNRSIHAEVDAINNLPPLRRKKKLVKVKLLVVRFSKRMKLADSRCCIRCCESIFKIPPLRGYTIENVAFSNESGCIEDHHPMTLLVDDEYHLSIYYAKRKYCPKIRNKIIANASPKVRLFMRKKKLIISIF